MQVQHMSEQASQSRMETTCQGAYTHTCTSQSNRTVTLLTSYKKYHRLQQHNINMVPITELLPLSSLGTNSLIILVVITILAVA